MQVLAAGGSIFAISLNTWSSPTHLFISSLNWPILRAALRCLLACVVMWTLVSLIIRIALSEQLEFTINNDFVDSENNRIWT